MNQKIKVHIALWIVTIIYGATFSIAKQVMPIYIKPFAFILLRVSVASVLIILFHKSFIKEKITDKKDYLKLLVCAIFGVAANMMLFFKGLSITTPINASVLMMNTPIFVIVIAMIWHKEKLSFQKLLGVLLASLGAIMLVGGRKFQFDSESVLGDMMVAANAIIYAFYLVYAKQLIHKYHPLTVTLYSFLFGTLLVLPFGAYEFSLIEWYTFTPKIWLFVGFITIGSTFLTYVLNAYALRHASSSLVGSYIYLQPVCATLIAITFATDELNFEKLIFMVIVFIGVYLASIKKAKTQEVIMVNE
ncbi:MAG: DMT family transporter [Bacteroidia bacterium]|nr:DMT family transporter [Bacteroidia bacterium]